MKRTWPARSAKMAATAAINRAAPATTSAIQLTVLFIRTSPWGGKHFLHFASVNVAPAYLAHTTTGDGTIAIGCRFCGQPAWALLLFPARASQAQCCSPNAVLGRLNLREQMTLDNNADPFPLWKPRCRCWHGRDRLRCARRASGALGYSPLADELPPIFLDRQPAAHGGPTPPRWRRLGHDHGRVTFRQTLSDATWLWPNLDEAGSERAAISRASFTRSLIWAACFEGGAFRHQFSYYCSPTSTNRELRGQK